MTILEDSHQNDLLARLKKGDEKAFNGIYAAYGKPMYLKMLRMVRDKDIADELLQELFIKLWDNREKIIPEKPFQPFIYTVARNLVYNYFRKVASDNTLIEQLILRGTEHYLSGEDILLSKEASALLKDAINQLSPQRKQVFELCKLEGRSYEEAGKILGISVATVNSHMTKALQSIKTYMLTHRDTGLLLISCYLLSTSS
ncbi:RNA polymerase sigma factor [Pedobacter faecalis]|uniref:RNA polymerase sigma factor n=1 Tax=Pedobacter faecalis TaxID=3041495 RepID=UPI00254CC259|nr:RNA polymerase sigma factor [Pedobacter sp. ELA7]